MCVCGFAGGWDAVVAVHVCVGCYRWPWAEGCHIRFSEVIMT